MTDSVFLLYECGGRPIARHRLAFEQTVFEGAFSFKEAPNTAFGRTVATARLQSQNGEDVVPPLYEAKLLWCEHGEARVSGLEVDELTQKRTAQCWGLRFGGADREDANRSR